MYPPNGGAVALLPVTRFLPKTREAHLTTPPAPRPQSVGCRVQGVGCRVLGAGCLVQGAGCWKWGVPPPRWRGGASANRAPPSAPQEASTNDAEREFVINNLLVRIHSIIEMLWWTGLAPWEFISTFLEQGRRMAMGFGCGVYPPHGGAAALLPVARVLPKARETRVL